jgi:hypothetical protein
LLHQIPEDHFWGLHSEVPTQGWKVKSEMILILHIPQYIPLLKNIFVSDLLFTITLMAQEWTLRVPVLHQSHLSKGSKWK